MIFTRKRRQREAAAEQEAPRAEGARANEMQAASAPAGARSVGSAGSAVLGLARLVMLVALLIAVLIALAIVLVLVEANASNAVVKGIHEGANFFAGSFTGLITFAGHHPKRSIAVNWGIALVAYLIVGAILSGVIAGIGRRGVLFESRRRALPTH
jgi:hypothetical protein